MRRREDFPMQKHTLNLYAGDYMRLQHLYPPRIGAAKVIRDIVRAHIREIEKNAAKKLVGDLADALLMESANE